MYVSFKEAGHHFVNYITSLFIQDADFLPLGSDTLGK